MNKHDLHEKEKISKEKKVNSLVTNIIGKEKNTSCPHENKQVA